MKNNFNKPIPQNYDAVESCLHSEDATVVFSTKANPVSSIIEESTLGEFIVESEIGRGAMGRVYKAWQPSNEKYVALKTIDPFFSNSDLHLNRFMREGFAQDKLKHPNVVEVYGFGKIENTPYIAFDLIGEGETLRHRLLNIKEKLPRQEVVSIILSLARALEYSHGKMVIHRDVKPSNILLDGNVPKLTDFGLAFLKTQDVSRITHSGDIVGTIGYMPPEQVKGSSCSNDNMPTPQWDIYSLGATLYELLTGSLPFRAETNVRLIANIVEKIHRLSKVME
jgi:serine/threonine protein kinase